MFAGKTFFEDGNPGNYVLNSYKLVVINQHMLKLSVGHFLATKEKKGVMDSLRVWQPTSLKHDTEYNVIEMSNAAEVEISMLWKFFSTLRFNV